MWSFGANVYGQLGRTGRFGVQKMEIRQPAPPSPVSRLLTIPEEIAFKKAEEDRWLSDESAPIDTFTFISAGDYHSAAVDKNGRVYCWGLNSGKKSLSIQ